MATLPRKTARKSPSKPPGPAPTRSTQRRRSNKPASQGEAETVTPDVAASVPPPTLGIANAHKLIKDLWATLQDGPEAKFYSAADWSRVRLELWYGNELLTGKVWEGTGEEKKLVKRTPGAQAWASFQAGLADLLVSPAEKRRVGIELKAAGEQPVDENDAAADAAVAGFAELYAVPDAPDATTA